MAAIELQQQNQPALARTRQLVERSDCDLKLAMDAALAAGIYYARRSKIIRARRELKDLLREIEPTKEEKVDA